MTSASRPQTLKQAKRAYRKSAATVHLSASELAQAERRAVCQERADRIKEREARRKANLKRREEKIASERENARRTGRPIVEARQGGRKVGASQLDLGRFLGGLKKPGKDEEIFKYQEAEEDQESRQMREGQDDEQGDKLQQEQEGTAAKPLPMGPPAKPKGQTIVHDSVQMPLKEVAQNSITRRKPPSPPTQTPIFLMMDGAFDDCFPSNTQVQRELSPSLSPSELPTAYNKPPLMRSPATAAHAADSHVTEEVNDLLARISTQDLDFSDALTQTLVPAILQQETDILAQISAQGLEFDDQPFEVPRTDSVVESEALLAQICTQDLDFCDGFESEAKLSEAEYANDVTDHELEDLAIELELESSAEVA